MNNEKVTDAVVLCVTFALGDWNYFPFNFPIQLACIQSRSQGHFGFCQWYGYQITLFGDYTASEV